MTYKTMPEDISTDIRLLEDDLNKLAGFNQQNQSIDSGKALQIGLELKTTLERAEQLTLLYNYHIKRMAE